jgi:transposase-like protein
MPDSMLRNTREIMRDEMAVRRRLLAALEDGPKTIPEIAATLGLPSHEVLYWVMAARRYGLLKESSQPNAEDYFAYALVAKEQER